ncbi:MAG: cardiolipin synthase [Planctomycetales bacterium]|nr:cardiolipin synthase [Planctomycetales bacterium]
MPLTWSLLYLISEWLIRLGMIPTVMRRRRPSVAMAWLLIIFFQPWIGLLVYLLLGENRLPRRRIQRHARLAAHIQKLAALVAAEPHVVRPPLEPTQQALVQLAEKLGEKPILGGNRGELITETEEVIQRLIDDIDAAQDHVHLLYYIFADDETGHRVGGALARAVQRGVTCRLLADDVGSWRMFRRLGAQLIRQGVQLHAMLPVNLFRRGLARMDLRNHRKLAIIDGHTAYTGSHNIVNASYGHKHLVWHDVTARLTGPIVLQLQSIFIEDWYFETGQTLDLPELFPAPDVSGEIVAQSLPSGPTYPSETYHRLVVTAIYTAVRQIIITSPYLVPDEALLQALEVAVHRGVRVELILPQRSDQILVDAAARAYYQELLDAGVQIYLHTDGLLHSKTMSVDDSLALVGSGNFDIRSFYLNFELNLLAYGPEVTAALRFLQRRYLHDAVPLTPEAWRQRSRVGRLLDDSAKLLSPLL